MARSEGSGNPKAKHPEMSKVVNLSICGLRGSIFHRHVHILILQRTMTSPSHLSPTLTQILLILQSCPQPFSGAPPPPPTLAPMSYRPL